MPEEPKQVLPQKWTAAAADMHNRAVHHHSAGHEETRVGQAVHQLHDDRGLERREREHQEKRGYELRPAEERQTHPGHPFRAQLNDGRDEINRAEQRRSDEENKTNEPEGLSVEKRMKRFTFVRDHREWRVGCPAALGRTARDEKADQHNNAADKKRLVARHVYLRERHVRRADLQWHDEVSERRKGQRHDPKKDHDGAVHRAQRVVKLRRHLPIRHAAGPKEMAERIADHRQRLARIGELPAHQHHERKTEE